MTCTKGSRGWGHIRRLPSGRFQASYIGPDLRRHTGPHTYTTKPRAEGWLAEERKLLELDAWTAPERRAAASSARAITLSVYATKWVTERNIKPRTRDEYRAKLRLHVNDSIGRHEISAVTPAMVRSWYAALGTEHVRRNSHVYALLHGIFATATKDGLLQSNPCQIAKAMNPPTRRQAIILDVPEIAKLADAVPQRFRAMILISAWCGLRFGEVTELRRRDVDELVEVISVSRAVTRTRDGYQVATTKSGMARTVVVPPHVRADIKHHLDAHTAPGADALLFPNGAGQHLNDTVFRRFTFGPAIKAIGREGIRVHDLRHFQGTMIARVGNLPESMARLGHSTVRASLIYQSVVSGRDAEIAAALSTLAQQG
jgi:integrase